MSDKCKLIPAFGSPEWINEMMKKDAFYDALNHRLPRFPLDKKYVELYDEWVIYFTNYNMYGYHW